MRDHLTLLKIVLPAIFCGIGVFSFVNADEFTSSSYRVLDPVLAPAGYAASSGFQLWSTLTEVAVGTSSASSFQLGGGFLRFPFASTPSVSVTPGDSQIVLSWTVSEGYMGWSASGYSIGQSTVSGGPYTYTTLGNVTSTTEAGLSNGTVYYFVIVVKDAFGNAIATSTQVTATPVASSGGGGGSSGGGGGGTTSSSASVVFSGRAYPLSNVSILKDGQLAVTTIAGPDSKFFVSLSNLATGNYSFAVYGTDKNGTRSESFTFPLFITAGVTTNISGIFLAPTIAVDKTEVRRGDTVVIFGQSTPSSEITINVNSDPEYFVKRQSDSNGVYLLNFDSSVLQLGQHNTKSKSAIGEEVSPYSRTVGFLVGTKNVLTIQGVTCPTRADLNSDCRVNLVDFSIAAFWYQKSISAQFAVIEKERLNGDGKINLIDFSIMAYEWTG